jgi:hypothetical protein
MVVPRVSSDSIAKMANVGGERPAIALLPDIQLPQFPVKSNGVLVVN